jgi:hypothetical protein
MNLSHTFKTLSPKATEARRRQLQSCFDYLLEHDNGPQDENPDPFEFSLEERMLSDQGFEKVYRLQGRVEGSTVGGLVAYQRQQVVPDEDVPIQHWHIVYGRDGIVCDQWSADLDGDPLQCRQERISRQPSLPSEVEEWKLAGLS